MSQLLIEALVTVRMEELRRKIEDEALGALMTTYANNRIEAEKPMTIDLLYAAISLVTNPQPIPAMTVHPIPAFYAKEVREGDGIEEVIVANPAHAVLRPGQTFIGEILDGAGKPRPVLFCREEDYEAIKAEMEAAGCS